MKDPLQDVENADKDQSNGYDGLAFGHILQMKAQ